MVDVGTKTETRRIARAAGMISMKPETLAMVLAGNSKKGDVIGIARIAAIQGAKRTAELIPLCHPIPLTRVTVDFSIDEAASRIACEVIAETVGRTGVEMEALTAVQVGLLTIYDMCKAVDRGMRMDGIRLLEKGRRQIGALGGRGIGSWHPGVPPRPRLSRLVRPQAAASMMTKCAAARCRPRRRGQTVIFQSAERARRAAEAMATIRA